MITKQFLLGFSYYPNADSAAIVLSVSEDYPMHQAGILPDDVITHIDGVKLSTGAELASYMDAHPLDGTPVKVTFERKSGEENFQLK